jgi:hypothetical protein
VSLTGWTGPSFATSRLTPIGLEHQVPVDDDANRNTGPDRDSWLDVERSPDNLFADLRETLLRALAQRLGKGVFIVVGAGFRTDAQQLIPKLSKRDSDGEIPESACV